MDAYRQLPDFQSARDPILDLCADVAAQCRMMIRKNHFVTLSPKRDELPPELISPACDIVVFKILKRMPENLTDPRQVAYKDAMELLRQVAAEELRPESYSEDDGDDDAEDLRNMPFLCVNCRPHILR
jgi:phage gp36-like protein